ncbi:uncharacterized protein AMSG_04113 [Thecamonas trahens ATCC 50062]|uniref:Uncharacterized protein n=1 Tax=Thecamonas trahens ATCC 50062 TaxID=461836 RepID=A0A0L0D9A2_THETB|nr:hypothetical protein AMSG_04113 [Thecamonas trahens ATCC 50062]KNC47883.1 hypothetical protein AMSG_04113 [Thecamonas trahens ATCC 50062]|eukprot:XP_013759361.1 hypothetical protein AMSG_04113 [Thecamonas trahens ATCC 50062]
MSADPCGEGQEGKVDAGGSGALRVWGGLSGTSALASGAAAIPEVGKEVLELADVMQVDELRVDDIEFDLESAESFEESAGRYVRQAWMLASDEDRVTFEMKRKRAAVEAEYGGQIAEIEEQIEEAKKRLEDATSIEWLKGRKKRLQNALGVPTLPDQVIEARRRELVHVLAAISEHRDHPMVWVVGALEKARDSLLRSTQLGPLDAAVKAIHRAKSSHGRTGHRFEAWCAEFVASWIPSRRAALGIVPGTCGWHILISATMYRGESPPERSKMEFDVVVVRETGALDGDGPDAARHVAVEWVFEAKLSPSDLRGDLPGMARALTWYTGCRMGGRGKPFATAPVFCQRKKTPFYVDSTSFDVFRAVESTPAAEAALGIDFGRVVYLTLPLRRVSMITPPALHITAMDLALRHPQFSLDDTSYLRDVYHTWLPALSTEWGPPSVTTALIESIVGRGNVWMFDESLLVVTPDSVVQ